MNKNIPTPRRVVNPSIPKQNPIKSNDKILFSFSIYERNEYFDLDVSCEGWFSLLISRLKDVSTMTKNELIAGTGKKALRFHSINDADFPCQLPFGVDKEDLYQIGLSTGNGRIHGRLVENIFYIIWFDPLHNLYPNKHFGGLKKINPGKTCCDYKEEELIKMNEEIQKLKKENEDLMMLIDNNN